MYSEKKLIDAVKEFEKAILSGIPTINDYLTDTSVSDCIAKFEFDGVALFMYIAETEVEPTEFPIFILPVPQNIPKPKFLTVVNAPFVKVGLIVSPESSSPFAAATKVGVW